MPDEKEPEILVNFRTQQQLWVEFSRIVFEQYGRGGIKKVFTEYIKDFIKKYDGKLKGMDMFLDPSYIPEPNITDTTHNKLKWISLQPIEKQRDFREECYRMHIMLKAIIEDPNNISIDYVTLWRQYK